VGPIERDAISNGSPEEFIDGDSVILTFNVQKSIFDSSYCFGDD
jgi:hypothetical protein